MPYVRRFLSTTSLLTCLLAFAFICPKLATAQEKRISFRNDVRPIFQRACFSCHGGVKNAGGIKLTDAASLAEVIQSGSPDESSLVERIESTDDELRMPPPDHGHALTLQETRTIRRWIEEGAAWEGHWAYEPPISPQVPNLSDALTQSTPTSVSSVTPLAARDAIDAFVIKRFLTEAQHTQSLVSSHANASETSAWRMNDEASPEQWLRRAYVSIVGELPTFEERAHFNQLVEQIGDNAYERTVDELLASPRFGEHWATMWLDQVRYADSRGLGQDGPRTVWKYRDWVIDALNRDMPYDEFTRLQIAGDLIEPKRLESVMATAVHRLTQTNEEGGTDDEEFRVAAVIDRVNTIWQVWQGQTFGCVQCHDHPYDPYRHADYYSFMAFLNNTSDWDLNEEFPIRSVPVNSAEYATADAIDREIEQTNLNKWESEFALLTQASAWKAPESMRVSATKGTKVLAEANKSNEFYTDGTVVRDTDFTIDWTLSEQTPLAAIRVTLRPLHPESAKANTEVGAVVSYLELRVKRPDASDFETLDLSNVIVDEPEPFFDPLLSLDKRNQHGFGAYARIQNDRQAAFVLSKADSLPAGTQIQVLMQHRLFVLDAFPLVPRRVVIEYSDSVAWHQAINAPQLTLARQKLKELRKQRNQIASVTLPVMRELPTHLRRPTHIFIRGLFLTKDAEVQPAMPQWLLGKENPQPTDRLQLANWISSDKNPLTARVHVNRIWARLFGRGIVVSEEDFGSSGDAPSHPELLDHLANRFQLDYQWSQKKLIRSIVLSGTYRRDHASSTIQRSIDPDNKWLTRGPRIRMPAEVVRDSALRLAQLSDSVIGGPPAHPPIPQGVWKPFQGGDKWETPAFGKHDRYRRSLYTYTKRSIPYPILAAFDAPTREFCTARRMNSNTPTQSLMTLNDVTFVECSNAIATLAMKHCPEGTIDERVVWIWQHIIGRNPTPSEQKILKDYYADIDSREEPILSDIALMLLNHDEFFSN